MTKFLPQLANTETFELPEGRYWVGDPCFVIDEDRWDDFLEEVDGGETAFEFDGHDLLCIETGGDGSWDFEGKTYGIEAGLIAVIPAELVGQTVATNGAFVDDVDQVTVVHNQYNGFQGLVVGEAEIGQGFSSDEIVEYAYENEDYDVITTVELFAELMTYLADEGEEEIEAAREALPQFA